MSDDHDAGGDPACAAHAPSGAARRTMVLSLGLVIACGAVLAGFDLLATRRVEPVLAWWAIAPIAMIAQLMVFDVEFRRETYTFTFSEIPLVLGLFLAEPQALVVGRLLGELIFLVVKERQAPRKVALNLSAFLTETTLLLLVAHALGGMYDITDPVGWSIALVSVVVADLAGYAIVHRVLRWHGAPITFATIIGLGGVAIPVNTSFALLTGILLTTQPWATLLLASVASFLMLSYRSYTSLRQRFESLSLLYDFTRLVSGAKRPDDVLEAMLTQAKDLLRAERAEIWVRDGDAVLSLTVGDSGRSERILDADAAALIAGWFEDHPGTTLIAPGTHDPRVAGAVTAMLGARDAIVSPVTESGAVVGLVAVIDRLGEVQRFGESDRMMFATLANHASVALENGRLIDRLHHEAKTREHEARHDALTGLPNRAMFAERLHHELLRVAGDRSALAVGLLDLDGFKEINDTLGHQTGDRVLVEVARRLREAVPDEVLVARLGGDEFALLFPEHSSPDALESEARRICDDIARPLAVDHISLNVSGSIGLAVAPADGLDPANLLQRADVAMYSAKSGHGAGVAFYDKSRDENSPRRLRLATDLRAALADGDVYVVMQPKVGFGDGAIEGVEALARWRHPELGLIQPDEFVPIAERTGSIRDLTRFVLREALTEAASWQRRGLAWTVSVNIAVRNLLDDDFVATVDELVRRSGCDPARLVLEVTETGAMFDTLGSVDKLERLAALGVRISVDDFGTGYSSLSYLQRLPATEVKIDKAFVLAMTRDPRSDAIVRSILDLARNLGLRVVAEGVDNDQVFRQLAELGCDTAQGYLIARPMSPARLNDWATDWNLRRRGPHGPVPRATRVPIHRPLDLVATGDRRRPSDRPARPRDLPRGVPTWR